MSRQLKSSKNNFDLIILQLSCIINSRIWNQIMFF